MLLLGAIFLGLALGYTGISRESRLEYPGMEELERRNSNFGLMQVLQATNELRRYYLNDYLMQNGYDPGKKQSLHLFTYMLHGLARAYTPQINDALCIGLGIGIVPMQLAQEGARVDVVEINPAVVPLACRHFDLQTNKFNLVIDDGRHFLNRCGRRYDAIILDAFLGDSSPSHLLTREAFTAMRQALKPDGALVLNCFGELELGRDFFTASLEKTLRAVFKSVKVHSGRTGNIFMAASERSPFQFLHPTDSTNVYEPVQWQAEAAYTGIVETDPNHGRVLTDDFNPVEFHDAANRERLRRYLASRMRPDSEE
jgi:spermidine synthase